MINRVQIDGFIEEAPMLQELPEGETRIATWILRHERKSRNDVVMFNTFRCVAWDKMSDIAAGLGKGDFIRASGALQSYRDAETGGLSFQIAVSGIQRRDAPEALTSGDGVAFVNYGQPT